MSTRCQLKVTGGVNRESITLYHHCDGYPEHILEDITTTYNRVGREWFGHRAGKVAAFLCETHPAGFEPEEGHDLHGDIEWYYLIEIDTALTGNALPPWKIKVHTVPNEKPVLAFEGTPDTILAAMAAYIKAREDD